MAVVLTELLYFLCGINAKVDLINCSLETKIADLNKGSTFENKQEISDKDSLTFLEKKEKELSEILNKKEPSLRTELEENQFLKKISNIFSNNKSKNTLEKEEVYPLKEEGLSVPKNEERPLVNLSETVTKKDDNEQINLLEMDEDETSSHDEDDVLEIPAFLRRQAN